MSAGAEANLPQKCNNRGWGHLEMMCDNMCLIRTSRPTAGHYPGCPGPASTICACYHCKGKSEFRCELIEIRPIASYTSATKSISAEPPNICKFSIPVGKEGKHLICLCSSREGCPVTCAFPFWIGEVSVIPLGTSAHLETVEVSTRAQCSRKD